jgi:phage gp29-like protein
MPTAFGPWPWRSVSPTAAPANTVISRCAPPPPSLGPIFCAPSARWRSPPPANPKPAACPCAGGWEVYIDRHPDRPRHALPDPGPGRPGPPHALPTLTGVRQIWDAQSVASGLTPASLAALLTQADQGDGRAYLRLAMEMEQREAHYRSLLATRKRAVTRLPVTVEAASDAPADVALADEIRALTRAPGFRGLLADALDGLGKGYAVIEICWVTSRAPWVPRDRLDPRAGAIKAYRWLDPRWFCYDRATGRELRLRDDQAPLDGLPLPPYRYLVHEPELMSGQPLGRGQARVACIAYLAKSYSLKDWLAFAEVYGMPLRLGKYGPSASEEDIATLVSAVANLGTDAAAVIPESMLIKFIATAQAGAGADVFQRLAEWADKQLSKAVLGQTASTEGQPGSLGGQDAQDEVRADLRDADAAELADTLNRDLVAAYLTLNHGGLAPEDSPRLVISEPDQDDIPVLTDALAKLVPLGLRVEQSVIRDKLGLPDPPDGAVCLGPPAAPAPADPADTEASAEPEDPEDPDEPKDPKAPPPALHRTAPASDQWRDPAPMIPAALAPDGVGAQVAALGQAAEPILRDWLTRVRTDLDAYITAGRSLADFSAHVLTLYPELPGDDLANIMGEVLAAADLAGRYAVTTEGADD